MSVVESWRYEVLVHRMNLKTIKRVNRCYRVLPDVAYDVIEATVMTEHVDRTRGHPELHVDVAHRLILPFRLIDRQQTPQSMPLVFCRQSGVLPCLDGPPLAESACLEVVDLGWPVPGHRNLS